jgi:hypothetical protein
VAAAATRTWSGVSSGVAVGGLGPAFRILFPIPRSCPGTPTQSPLSRAARTTAARELSTATARSGVRRAFWRAADRALVVGGLGGH